MLPERFGADGTAGICGIEISYAIKVAQKNFPVFVCAHRWVGRPKGPKL